LIAGQQVTVERVRLRGAEEGAHAARRRLSYLLSSATLRPSRMPPSAVLVVRSMPDPLPGAITKEFASAARPSPTWERAAEARLGALLADAARPARSVVRSCAEAVLFADEGELLACLALDLATGAELAWWWRSILRHHLARFLGARSELWTLVWADEPHHAPAAMQLLAERNEAVRALERIAPPQAWRLLLAVARAFGLPVSRLIAAYEEAGVAPATGAKREGPIAPAEARPDDAEDGSPRAATAPWEPCVAASDVPHALGVERSALLGVSLLLHRAPRLARSARFAPRFRAWLARERTFADGKGASAPASPASARSELRVDPGTGKGAGAETAASEKARTTSPDPFSPSPAPGERSPPPGRGSARRGDQPAASAEADLASAAPAPADAGANDAAASAVLRAQAETVPPRRRTSSFAEARARFEDGSPTRFGGILYLVHVLLRSDLLSFDVGLRGWALLELLARCLLFPKGSAVAEDTVWDALALLDFREPGSDPGADFTPQPIYAAPECWLRGLDESPLYARFRGERLELWREEGFLTLDATRPVEAPLCARMTRRERRAFRKDASVRAVGTDLAPALRRFLHFVLPYVRWRLRRALGRAPLADVLQRRGTLYVTRSHVDLVMRMGEITMPARVAGLDADPGWTPELGRIIRFHFVDDFDGGAP
jgi:hypothetical protein